MQIDIEFEECTGLISKKGRILFFFTESYVSIAAKLGTAPSLPSDFLAWNGAQGTFTSADSAPVMVTLQVDTTDPKRANVISQQKGSDFSGRKLHASNGLSVGAQIDVYYPDQPATSGPSKFSITKHAWS
ncbi:TPA: hypothetical protein QDZ42_003972 [Stenotrophomonas maltophilia]|nr:hypothetical protein [Stenotrophomonas maltophilia]HDS1045286.1 hypothetical protein [Stenotrophomonas maltophilia]